MKAFIQKALFLVGILTVAAAFLDGCSEDDSSFFGTFFPTTLEKCCDRFQYEQWAYDACKMIYNENDDEYCRATTYTITACCSDAISYVHCVDEFKANHFTCSAK